MRVVWGMVPAASRKGSWHHRKALVSALGHLWSKPGGAATRSREVRWDRGKPEFTLFLPASLLLRWVCLHLYFISFSSLECRGAIRHYFFTSRHWGDTRALSGGVSCPARPRWAVPGAPAYATAQPSGQKQLATSL